MLDQEIIEIKRIMDDAWTAAELLIFDLIDQRNALEDEVERIQRELDELQYEVDTGT
jgi:hypothetical protein